MSGFELDRSRYRFFNSKQHRDRSPYPFQEKAINALNWLRINHPEGFASMLVLPTGAGKTYTAAHWILKTYLNQGIKVLWVAHRSELLRQAAETFYSDTSEETLPDRDGFYTFVSSAEFGRCCNVPADNPDLLIASRQSLCSGCNLDYVLKWAKGKGLKADRKLLIVLDEAHHAAAVSYRRIIDTMKKYIPHVDVLGLTATPYRTAQSEQGSLKKIFSTGSGIVYSIDLNSLIDAGILSLPKHMEVNTNVDMTQLFDEDELRTISRYDLSSLDEKSLNKLNENADRNKRIVDTYLADRDTFGQTIVFAVDRLNAIALQAIFRSVGVRSDYVVSGLVDANGRSLPLQRNAEIIRQFREGALEVLINVNIVTEGTDIPNVQSVFLARPTRSKILMTQMIGRGLRGEAAGGTKTTNLVYFVDEWRGLVDFVSPRALLDGEDSVQAHSADNRAKLRQYIQFEEIEAYALGGYQNGSSAVIRFHNIIPYGIIRCAYLNPDGSGEETEVSKDVVVYDEALSIFQKILAELPAVFSDLDKEYTSAEVREAASSLFFRFCEKGNGSFIGISSGIIRDLIMTYLQTQEIPQIRILENRVSLFDVAKEKYAEGMREKEIDAVIEDVWNQNEKIRGWYDKDFYYGLMRVYFNRMSAEASRTPEFVLPQKEKMDMQELKKYYPEYFRELREYLILHMKKDEEGYYYSAVQEDGEPPVRSKHLAAFEMDHIIPISKGGLTVRENLQMITRKQNREKSDSV